MDVDEEDDDDDDMAKKENRPRPRVSDIRKLVFGLDHIAVLRQCLYYLDKQKFENYYISTS